MDPPKGLSKEATALWRMVIKNCQLMPNEFTLLKIACQSFDEMQKARALLDKYGLVIKDARVGMRCNPAAAILKDSRQSFLRTWKALNFKSEDAPMRKPGRPPERLPKFCEDDEED